MELVLGSPVIPDSGTASVRARPTVKHHPVSISVRLRVIEVISSYCNSVSAELRRCKHDDSGEFSVSDLQSVYKSVSA